MGFLTGPVRQCVVLAASRCVIEQFLDCSLESLRPVPTDVLVNIFTSHSLAVTHEDFLFDIVKEMAAERGAEAHALWACCRFADVSVERLRWARDHQVVPTKDVWDSLVRTSQEGQRQSFSGIFCLLLVDNVKGKGKRYMDTDDWVCIIQHWIESRGGCCEVFLYGRDALDIIISDKPVDDLRQDAQVQHWVDRGCGLVILKDQAWSDIPDNWDLDPLGVSKGRGKGFEDEVVNLGVRKGKALAPDTDMMARQLSSGVQVEMWRPQSRSWFTPIYMGDGGRFHEPRAFRLLPGARVLIELKYKCGVPIVVLHPTKRVAVFWDNAAYDNGWKLVEKGCPTPQLQLLLNTMLVFARSRMPGSDVL